MSMLEIPSLFAGGMLVLSLYWLELSELSTFCLLLPESRGPLLTTTQVLYKLAQV